jgi:anti-sigma regulatory factor (Ser/Thr protein kinase)
MAPSPAAPLTMHERLPAMLDSVAAARRAVRRFAVDLDVDVDGIVLAVSEAVANVVIHAYDGASGTLELSAVAEPFDVTVTVRDHGHGFAAAGGGDGAGQGLTIIRRLAQHVRLEQSGDGVELTMHFRRGGAWSVR